MRTNSRLGMPVILEAARRVIVINIHFHFPPNLIQPTASFPSSIQPFIPWDVTNMLLADFHQGKSVFLRKYFQTMKTLPYILFVILTALFNPRKLPRAWRWGRNP